MLDYMGLISETTIDLRYSVEDRLWLAVVKTVQKRSYDLAEWITKDFAVKAYDKDKDKAFSTAMVSMNAYLGSINYDMFKEEENV